MRAPKTRLPPKGSNLCTLPVAASAESIAGSPAYTPLQNGSMRRSNASLPRFLDTNSFTDSSRPGAGGRIPIAPRPARIFPVQVRKVPSTAVGMSLGSARSSPSQSTNRSESGSANTISSRIPASHANVRIGSPGWYELGPSSHVYPFSLRVVMFPPTLSLASVTSIEVDGESFINVNAVDKPETPAPTMTVSYLATAAVAVALSARTETRAPLLRSARGGR
mmetsp:Transcript_12294/g.40891  ORF Transcript_12294/g.40891 Transcript_12294/m.40891 type:complete len:222 (-) Transcript_12294:52-717(-)